MSADNMSTEQMKGSPSTETSKSTPSFRDLDQIDEEALTAEERASLERQAHYDAEEVTTSELRANMADVVSRVAYGDERYLVTRNGEPVAGIIPLYMLEKLIEWEDAQLDKDVQKAQKEYEETGKRTRRQAHPSVSAPVGERTRR